MKKRAWIVTVAAVICAAIVICAVYTATAAENQTATRTGPTLYINDNSWYKDFYRLEVIYGRYYVPLSIFEEFSGIEVKIDRVNMEFFINDTVNERYISFGMRDEENNYLALTSDKSGIKSGDTIRLYKFYDGEMYVPLDIVAGALKLDVSVYVSKNDPKTIAVRVNDGSGKKTFEELVKMYDITLTMTAAQLAEAENAEETTAPAEVEVDPADIIDTEKRTIYLTFDNCPNENTIPLLDMLAEYGYKATFFLSGEDFASPDNIKTIIRMIAEGHTVGLQSMTRDEKKFAANFNSFIAEIEAQNELLMKVIKQKTHIVRAPDGSVTSNMYINSHCKNLIEKNGYVIWDWNVDSNDGGTFWHKNVSLDVIKNIPEFIKPVIRFRTTGITLEAMPEILEFISKHENYTVKAITASDIEVNDAGYYDS